MEKLKMSKIKGYGLVLLAWMLWLAGCQSANSTSDNEVVVPTATRAPMATNGVSVPDVAATVPPPVMVEIAPAATATLVVVAEPATATPLPEVTEVLTAELMPANFIGPTFPDNINPFTGLVVDPAILDRRPIAIKVSNSSAIVRPQAGLSQADIVFEHYAEGGITRFTVLFYAKDAPLVGPVRSGRIIDLEIPKMYDAAFGYSGASGPVKEMFRNSPFYDRIISQDFGHGGFWRDYDIGDPNKPGWETLYTSTDSLRKIIIDRGLNVRPNLPANLVFSQETPTNGSPGNISRTATS